uniref:RelA/SpoT domain-containing protein n=1 Tax=Entomoneis paludosa TaxID=265537 RepID=A0A7S2V6V5_9STRA
MTESHCIYNNRASAACRPRRRRTALGFTALLAALCNSQSNAFGAVKTATRQPTTRRIDSSLFFRSEGTETLASPPVFSSSLLHATAPASKQQKKRTHLPAWLAMPKGHLTEYNLQQLQTALRESYFTENESLKLLFAIEEAAAGDRHKIAGAAEFCVMLLETMELGLEALVAAAFHYCGCVNAREQGTSVLSEQFNMGTFGDEVVQISRDAARLKELEMVASRVVEQKQQHGRADAENLRMMLLSESKDWRALAIRSAACLFRLRGLLNSSEDGRLDPERVRVAREGLWIYAPIASRLGMHRLKSELEGAAFQILHKRQYDRVIALTSKRETPDGPTAQEAMNDVLHHVQEDMIEMLKADEHFSTLVKDFTVTARVKEPYSMWRKMLQHGYQNIWEVPDAVALRIVLNAKPIQDDEPIETIRARERALCYYAQRLCTDRWVPQPHNPRFKDYIDKPKPNGYQSLHYTANAVHGNKNLSLEIQVRSGDMHQVAEFGLASHWDYKAQKKPTSQSGKQDSKSSDSYMQKVQQWHWEQQGGASLRDEEESIQEHSDFEDASWLESSESSTDLFESRIRSERIRARTQRIQPYIEALTTAQSDLTRDFVFVFFEPHGAVLSLPAGACVVDALRKGCNGSAWQHLAATNLNGSKATVTKRLNNGDVLTVGNI